VGLAAFVAASCFVLGLSASAVASAQDYGSSSPSEVVTEPAEATATGVKLKGKLNPNGAPTTYYFAYARDTCDEGCTPNKTTAGGPLTGDTQQEVPAVEVTGLAPGRYWYTLVASNAEGVTGGGLVQFTTLVPVITSLEPNHGPTSGGTTVIIHGEPLENARSVHFGTVQGKILHEECDGECEIVPYTTLVVESPPHAAGTVDVTVETAQGMSVATPGDKFTYGPSSGPLIESESVSNVTPTDATLEAKIDTQGLATLFQFTLQPQPCSYHGVIYCELVGEPIPLPSGELLGSFVGQSVSLDLNSAGVHLRPGEEYSYSVIATSAAGSTEGPSQTFGAPSAVDQPAGSSGPDQPAGPAGSSFPPTPTVGALGAQTGRASQPKPQKNARRLAKALRACEKRPKHQRAKCEKHARVKYGATASKGKS
jgi:IPT/TIG domain